jgi:hypothetical protein
MRSYIDSFIRVACAAAVAVLAVAAPAAAQQAQSWISTDVGSVGAAGSATVNDGVWTISGGGSDIWGTADSFQFLHTNAFSGFVTARIEDLQNTSPFAKAGVMFRTSTVADAETVILDVKPNGEIEFMSRSSRGAPMQFIATATVTLPVWLRLQTSGAGVTASTSPDGITWTVLPQSVPAIAGGNLEAGVAVTSHDLGQLNTAHVSHLTIDPVLRDWANRSIGAVGLTGTALRSGDQWILSGAGSDIWGTADAFQFWYRHTAGNDQHLRMRVDSLDDRHPFAKAGLMVRDSVDPDSPTVIVDVKPDGGVEFMARSDYSAEMSYLGGANVTFPAWLDLSWQSVPGSPGTATFSAAVSQDKVTWTQVPGTASLWLPNTLYEVGLAVTSHLASATTTAVVRGLSLTPIDAASDDIGSTGLVGNAATDITQCCDNAIVQGGGSDIWGTADSFQFAHGPGAAPGDTQDSITFRVLRFEGADPFGKAGLMMRDTLRPDAMHVLLDVRPTGDVEFMARMCTGCETTFLGTAKVVLPALFRLTRTGGTFEAFYTGAAGLQSLGTVDVPMAQPIPGYAVTSHNTTRIATAVFDMPH